MRRLPRPVHAPRRPPTTAATGRALRPLRHRHRAHDCPQRRMRGEPVVDTAAQAGRHSTGRRNRRWGRWIRSRGGQIRPAGCLNQPEMGKKGPATGTVGVEEDGRPVHRCSRSVRLAAAMHATRRPEEVREEEGPEQCAAVKPHHGLSTRPERPHHHRPWELHGLLSGGEAQLCWRGAATAGVGAVPPMSPCMKWINAFLSFF